jgi:endonuclease YncB( thermonuclease family)
MFTYEGIVTNVVDGDTIDIDIKIAIDMKYLRRCRLLGLNCPELHKEGQREKGSEAKEFTTQRLLNQPVTITLSKADAFGRWLVNIVMKDGTDFNQELLSSGHAVPYYMAESPYSGDSDSVFYGYSKD